MLKCTFALVIIVFLSLSLSTLSIEFNSWCWDQNIVVDPVRKAKFFSHLSPLHIKGRIFLHAQKLVTKAPAELMQFLKELKGKYNMEAELLIRIDNSDRVVLPESMVEEAAKHNEFVRQLIEKGGVPPPAIHFDLEPGPHEAIYNLTVGAGLVKEYLR